MRDTTARRRGALLVLVLALLEALGCTSSPSDAGSAVSTTASAGGASHAGGAGGATSADAGAGGAAAADAGLCYRYSGDRLRPTGYDLASYAGSVEGLCDAAASLGCDTNDVAAGISLVCSADFAVCCQQQEVFEPQPCGWIDCWFDEPDGPTNCPGDLPKTVHEQMKEDTAPRCRFCTSDADCLAGTACTTRVANRMICGPT